MRTSTAWWAIPLALLLACGGNGGAGGAAPPGGGGPGGSPDAGGPPPPPPPPPPPERFELPPLQTSLQDYALEMPDATLQTFLKDRNAPEADATFVAGGQRYPAKVRLRGASARYFPKVSWNVDLGAQKFEGRGSLNLVAEFQDRTMMTEKLAYDLLAAMHVPAPRAKFVRLKVNGRFEGVYVDLEQVGSAFPRAHGFADPDATVFRCGWKDCEFKAQKLGYQGDWVQKNNTGTSERAELDAMLRRINGTPDPQLVPTLEQHLELEPYLRTLVLDVLLANNFVQDSESYFLFDHVTRRWSYVPWDLNNVDARWWPSYALGARPHANHTPFSYTLYDAENVRLHRERVGLYPGYLPAWNNLATRVLAHPELRARVLARYDQARKELFTPELLHARIDAMYALIAPDVERSPYLNLQADPASDGAGGYARDANGYYVYGADPDGLAKFREGRRYLKDFVTQRIAYLDVTNGGAMARFRKPQAQALAITAFDPNGNWVDLENLQGAAVDLSQVVLTTNLRRVLLPANGTNTCDPAADWPACLYFPGDARREASRLSGTLGAGQKVRVRLADLGMSLAGRTELGVFTGRSVDGAYDFAFFGPLPAGQQYVRTTTDDALRWEAR